MNWKALKQLNQLFNEGETSSEILQIPLVQRWHEMEFIERINKKTVAKTKLYDSFYKKELLPQFNSFENLLTSNNLTETNFKEKELSALLRIQNDKEEILITGKSQKEIATLYFDSAKYLTEGRVLFNSILKILQVTELSTKEHDQQFLFVLHCKNKIPKSIILCENLNNLGKARLNDVELWFAGGRNTAKLKFVVEPTIPFYYLCDWDNRGIEIYQDIKKNIFPNIQILIPQEPIKFDSIISKWKTKIDDSLFPDEAKKLLEKLIPDKWIEEESINHELLKK
jgi:hypothetical protein